MVSQPLRCGGFSAKSVSQLPTAHFATNDASILKHKLEAKSVPGRTLPKEAAAGEPRSTLLLL